MSTAATKTHAKCKKAAVNSATFLGYPLSAEPEEAAKNPHKPAALNPSDDTGDKKAPPMSPLAPGDDAPLFPLKSPTGGDQD
eukprot:5390414-Ditylum_brightwellii.AAC.1